MGLWLCYTVRMKSIPKLSKTSKMPAKSWSLPAWETCPGARSDGKPAEACEGCYALTGAYQFPSTIKAREHNLEDWKKDDWCDAMVKAIGKDKYFRWFDSGDIYCMELAEKIIEVVRRTPDCKHWLPTRSHKAIQGLYGYLTDYTKEYFKPNKYEADNKPVKNYLYLPNLTVRFSSDSVHGVRLPKVFGRNSVIIQHEEDFKAEKGYALCRAYTRGGKCGDCRACWSNKVDTVAYVKHGKKVNPKKFEKSLTV